MINMSSQIVSSSSSINESKTLTQLENTLMLIEDNMNIISQSDAEQEQRKLIVQLKQCIEMLHDFYHSNTIFLVNNSTITLHEKQVSVNTLSYQANNFTNSEQIQHQKIIAKSYILINKIRQLLTQIPLIYHYYYTDANGNICVAEFNDDQAENFMTLVGTELRIVSNKIINAVNTSNGQASLNKEYTQLANILKQAAEKVIDEGFRLKSWKSDTIYIVHRNLRVAAFGGNSESKIYNLGQVYEAIDRTIAEQKTLIISNMLQSYWIKTLAVIENLRNDSVPWTQGGDINKVLINNILSNIQVKSNNARFSRLWTIRTSVDRLYNIFNMTSSKGTHLPPGELKKRIKTLFFDKASREAKDFAKSESNELINNFVQMIKKY